MFMHLISVFIYSSKNNAIFSWKQHHRPISLQYFTHESAPVRKSGPNYVAAAYPSKSASVNKIMHISPFQYGRIVRLARIPYRTIAFSLAHRYPGVFFLTCAECNSYAFVSCGAKVHWLFALNIKILGCWRRSFCDSFFAFCLFVYCICRPFR